MRYLILAVLLYSNTVSACIVGPQQITPTEEVGFIYKEVNAADLCEGCRSISINAPSTYQNKPISHAVFTTYLNGKLISKSLSYFETQDKEPLFFGLVNKELTYTVEIEYGHSKCASYKFSFSK